MDRDGDGDGGWRMEDGEWWCRNVGLHVSSIVVTILRLGKPCYFSPPAEGSFSSVSCLLDGNKKKTENRKDKNNRNGTPVLVLSRAPLGKGPMRSDEE